MPSPPPFIPRQRTRRWLVVALGLVLVVGVVGLIALPILVRTEFARGKILGAINTTFAPGRVDVERFEVAWTGPTRLVGFRLLAPDGAEVVKAPVAHLNRTLGGLLLRPGQPATLLLDRAALEIQRHADGKLDLTEALQAVIAHPDPTRDLTVRVTRGSLILRADQLAEPIQAETADLDLHIPPAPQAMTWNLKLGHADGGAILARGDMNRWTARDQDPSLANLQLDLEARRWPIRVRTENLDARGWLNGSVELGRTSEHWRSHGNLQIHDASATGPALAGDALRPGLVTLVWDGQEAAEGWTIRRLSVDSALGSIRAEGGLDDNLALVATGAEPPRIEGRLDLPVLARQIPHALRLRPDLVVEGGTARFKVEIPAARRTLIRTEATIADLVAVNGSRRLTLRAPLTLDAEINRADRSLTIEKLTARTGFATVAATGRLDDLRLDGSADLGALRQQLGDWVDLGRLGGSGQAEIQGSYRVIDREYVARLAVEGSNLRLEGVTEVPITRTQATFDLTINGRPSASGWPTAWDAVLLSAASSGSTGRVELCATGTGIDIQSRLSAELPGQPPTHRAEATLAGSWAGDQRLLRCDRVVARLVPGTAEDDAKSFEFTARGEIDARAGTIRFDPITEPGSPLPPIRLAPAGVRVAGLGGDLRALVVDISLEGERVIPNGLTAASDHWSALMNVRGDDQGLGFDARGEIESDIGERAGKARVVGRYDRTANRIELVEYQARSAFGLLKGAGRLEDPTGSRRYDLQGELTPDFATITAWLERQVEAGAVLTGSPRPFHLAGTLAGSDPLGSMTGEVGFDLAGADVYGMKLGPTPVVIRAQGGKIEIDPISTTLNQGHLRLESELDWDGASGAPLLRLGKNSAIRGARINDEVSRRVLAYVAPVLEGATRASGRVSVDLDRAEFPLTSGRSKAVQVDGLVVFDDVVFAPGELANDLLGVLGRRDAVLRIERPITLTIADGRVNQSGLALPIGGLTRIEFAGWVDFEKNLALTATLPVTPAMLGHNPLLADIAAGTQVRVPISGTLTRPTVDQEAFATNMKLLGKSLLTRGATRGALELLRRMRRDPSRPPAPDR